MFFAVPRRFRSREGEVEGQTNPRASRVTAASVRRRRRARRARSRAITDALPHARRRRAAAGRSTRRPAYAAWTSPAKQHFFVAGGAESRGGTAEIVDLTKKKRRTRSFRTTSVRTARNWIWTVPRRRRRRTRRRTANPRREKKRERRRERSALFTRVVRPPEARWRRFVVHHVRVAHERRWAGGARARRYAQKFLLRMCVLRRFEQMHAARGDGGRSRTSEFPWLFGKRDRASSSSFDDDEGSHPRGPRREGPGP